MPYFLDSTGRRYPLNITLGTALSLREETDLDLLSFPWPKELPARLIAYLIRPRLPPNPDLARLFPERVRAAASRALGLAVREFFPPAGRGGSGSCPVPGDPWRALWRLGGRLGVDIRSFTPRQLLWMAEGLGPSDSAGREMPRAIGAEELGALLRLCGAGSAASSKTTFESFRSQCDERRE